MNLTDELAETTKELEEIKDKYNKLFEKLFNELNKYLSFIDDNSFNINTKTIYYKDCDYGYSNIFKATIGFGAKYNLNHDIVIYIEIKSSYPKHLLENVISKFCIANNLTIKFTNI